MADAPDPTAPRPPDPGPTRGGARTTHRRGRMTPARVRVLAELGPRWMLDPADAARRDALDRAFGRRAPRLLDVGVGNGVATRAWAAEHPDHDVVALDLHRPGLARLVADLDAGGPPNVRVVDGDVEVLLAAAEPGCFDAVRVLFPDPWPKRRHVERRLVDAAFVARVAALLPPGGTLHVATDWPDYAEQIRAALASEAAFGPVAEGRPPRPVTTYERRGIEAGRPVADLVVTRR